MDVKNDVKTRTAQNLKNWQFHKIGDIDQNVQPGKWY